MRKFHWELEPLCLHGLEIIEGFICKAGFSKYVVEDVTEDFRRSATCLYQRNGLDSSVSVIEGIFLYAKPLYSR